MFKRDLDFERKWQALLGLLQQTIGKKPKDLNFLIYKISNMYMVSMV